MIRCLGCGEIMEEGGAMRAIVSAGEAWGSEAAEYGAVCPVCGYDIFEDCEICSVCGEAYPEGEVWGEICEKCLSEAFDFEEGREYLRDVESEGCGWVDFVLTRVYGVEKCSDRAFLADALASPAADFQCVNGQSAAEAMRDYIFEDWHDYAQRRSE